MYEQYWGLNRNPFSNNTAAEFFFRSATHQAALLKMRYVVENRLGAGLLTGGIGYGKSYLIRMLAEELPDQFGPVIHLVFPQLTATELLCWIAVELGVDESELSAGTGGVDRTIRRIQRQLRNYAETNRYPVLVIDEAHLIEDRQVFQALQLLLNFQQQPDIDFSLFFIGERSLSSRINRMAQLDERIAEKKCPPAIVGRGDHRLCRAAPESLRGNAALLRRTGIAIIDRILRRHPEANQSALRFGVVNRLRRSTGHRHRTGNRSRCRRTNGRLSRINEL
jgi:type II secretory pathway predicted ATPase ExeA